MHVLPRALKKYAKTGGKEAKDRRQKMNFEVSDRIAIQFNKNKLLENVLEKYSDFIADETLAVSISEDNEESASEIFNFQIDNTEIKLSIEKQ